MSGLSSKVALITGAGGMHGVGRATALRLAEEGADIALTDLHRRPEDFPPAEAQQGWKGIENVAQEIEALGRRCSKHYCDLSKSEDIEELVRQVIAEHGHIDVLVNNAPATIGKDKVPITELSLDVFRQFLEINTVAVFYLTKLVAIEMVGRGDGGRIINIGSRSAKQAGALQTAYSASKHAVVGITQAAALSLAPYDITVNDICPGSIDTKRFSFYESAQAEKEGIPVEEFRARVLADRWKEIPMGRSAQPEEIAALVNFLASKDAGYITGQAYNINGGELFH